MSDVQIGRSARRDPVGEEAPVFGDGTSGNGASAADVLPARRWRPGLTTGVVAAAPSAAAATGSALIAACGSCLGLGSAAAFSATAAATGGAAGATSAAASSGLPIWQIGFAVVVFAVLIAVQLRRALAAARCRRSPGSRAAFVLRQIGPGLLAGAVAFAAVQLVVVPWLSAPPVPVSPTLP